MSRTSLESTVAVTRALGHPARLRALAMLRFGELCVCQVVAVLGLAASTVSTHLAVLRRAGLVEERKQGRWVLYRLAEREAEAVDVAAVLDAIADDPLVGRDAEVVSRLREVSLARLCGANLALRPDASTMLPIGPIHARRPLDLLLDRGRPDCGHCDLDHSPSGAPVTAVTDRSAETIET